MGVKRPFETEGFSDISFKQPKPIDYNEKLMLKTADFPSQAITPKADYPGVDKPSMNGSHENFGIDEVSSPAKELEASPELSNVTTSSEEEAEDGEASSFHYFPPYFDSSVSWKPPPKFEDPYTFLMNSSPRKEIPIGSEYQAEVPEWDSNSDCRDLIGFDYFVDKEISKRPSQQAEIHECKPSGILKDFSGLKNCSPTEEELRLMGVCIMPMPSLDDSDTNKLKVGFGRIDCGCLDVGSTRCVHQHVTEAREKLEETLGEEIFAKLGFYEMGEEVASRWNPDEEQTFHEVIYSNPASRGMNFWKVLINVFPTRSKTEIVSHYFNVFMLWKRAVQNRSYTLRINGDDDEDLEVAHGNDYLNSPILDQESEDEEEFKKSPFCLVGEVDHDEDHLAIETFKVGDLDVGWMEKIETELLNANGGENNVPSDNTSENISSCKIFDSNDGIEHRPSTAGDDCNEDAGNVNGERSQEAGKEAGKSQEHRSFDS